MSAIYITGGARSGKSTLAEEKARAFGDDVIYIATARALDQEMTDRIRAHKSRRPAAWATFEGVNGLADALNGRTGCALLDCVTNLITNLMLDMDVDWEHPGPEHVKEAVDRAAAELDALIDRANAQGMTLILVSNEVGMGLVPVYPFGRAFRDAAGWVNQRLAARADEAYLCASGIPICLKSRGENELESRF